MTTTGTTQGAGGELVAFEPPGPLSESLMWNLHDEYFRTAGIDAWSTGEVPFGVTTGPVLALSYARLVEGFAEDCAAGRFGPVDTPEPLFVVEIGAGSGRLGFNFLAAHDPERVAPLRLVYVLADRVEANVEFWSRTAPLRDYAEQGRVDFALVEAGSEGNLHLRRSGRELGAGRVANPVVVLANYLLDVQPQDLFSVRGDSAYEELVQVFGPKDAELGATSKCLRTLQLGVRPGPITEPRYRGRNEQLLRSVLAGSSSPPRRVLFPARAVEMLDSFIALSSGRLLFAVGERAWRDPVPPSPDELPLDSRRLEPELLRPGPFIGLGIHGGSISLPVDLRVLAEATRLEGGFVLSQRDPADALVVGAFVFGGDGDALGLRRAYSAAVDDLAPDSVQRALRPAFREGGQATLVELLSVIRMGRFDPRVFESCREALARRLTGPGGAVVDELVRVLRRVLELDYPMAESDDLAGDMAALLLDASRYEDALWFLERSFERRGPSPTRLVGRGRCFSGLGETDRALGEFEAALALDPSHAEAQRQRHLLLAEESEADT